MTAAVVLPGDSGSAAGRLAYWVSTWLWVPSYVPVPSLLLQLLPDGRLPGPRWRAAAEVAAFRVVGEALTNVARHARATRVHVVLAHRDGALHLCVADDGVGVRPGARTGVGLGSMHQRAAELGGSCTVTGGPGTTVRAVLPTGAA